MSDLPARRRRYRLPLSIGADDQEALLDTLQEAAIALEERLAGLDPEAQRTARREILSSVLGGPGRGYVVTCDEDTSWTSDRYFAAGAARKAGVT